MKKIISVCLIVIVCLNIFCIFGASLVTEADFSVNTDQSIGILSDEALFASDSNIASVYSYEHGHLNQISSENTTYRFDYDARNNVETSYVGDNLFADYSYTDSGLASSIVFGNAQCIYKNYDEYNRVKDVLYGNEIFYEYDYTNFGEVGIERDYHSSRIIRTDDVFEIKDMNTQKQLFLVEEPSIKKQTFTLNGKDKIFRSLIDWDSKTKVNFTTHGVNCNIESLYDDYGRVEEQRITSPSVNIISHYEYGNDVSDYVRVYKTVIETEEGIQQHSWIYKYDESGNVIEKSYADANGENAYYRYLYDEYSELIQSCDNFGTRLSVNYDNTGNILYTNKNEKANSESHQYTYSVEWGDKLVSYDGNEIEYDEIGNPISYQDNTYTWIAGRQLSSIANGDMIISYTYDEVGHRTKKTIEKTRGKVYYQYFWAGDTLIAMTISQGQESVVETVYFLYDMDGNVYGFIKNENELYLYEKSKTGDIIAIYGQNGVVASYEYDDYGNIIMATENDETISLYNPFYYRSYCYDKETEMYYLLSRYYVPQWGRFLNADAYFTTGVQAYATNMFAYCANNPINSSDLYGYWDKDDHKNWTKTTALQLDFWGSIPEKIGEGSRSVDIEMSTNPLRTLTKWKYNQRYHFNRKNFCDNVSNGEDTRLYYYGIYFEKAVAEKNRGNTDGAYDALGKALHFIQDVFSHGEIGVNSSFASHVGQEGVDAPHYNWLNSQQISVYKVPSNYKLDGCPQGYGNRYSETLFTTAAALIAYQR